MDTEIELKFLLSKSVENELPLIIQDLGQVQSSRKMRLHNRYFDTPDRTLRNNDIGLRVRTCDDRSVQTVKTAGSSKGGLHQRPEYNIEIDDLRPNLALFDRDIWPEGLNLPNVQESLTPLFQTNFDRTVWILTSDQDTVVEVAFDQGHVISGKDEEPILELELELVSGTLEGLFRLAKKMARVLPLRLSDQSKAARGYRLVNKQALACRDELGYVNLNPRETVEKSFIRCVSYGLQYVQYHEACYFSNQSLTALRKISDGFALIRHSLWLFSRAIGSDNTTEFNVRIKKILHGLNWVENARQLRSLTSSKGKFGKKLERRKELLASLKAAKTQMPDSDSVKAQFFRTDYCTFMLEINEWLELRKWRHNASAENLELANRSIEQLAFEKMEQSWSEVIESMPESADFDSDDYLNSRSTLTRSLLTGVCLGSLYSSAMRDEYRRPWLDIHHGMNELQNLVVLNDFVESQEGENDESLMAWLESKIGSLLLAMEQSRQSAIRVEPYWR